MAEGQMSLTGEVVCLLAAPLVQLFISASSGWLYNVLCVSCHLQRDTVLVILRERSVVSVQV